MQDKGLTILEKIASESIKLGYAERRLADFIASSPSSIPQMSLATLAKAANVSDPTVLRFCRKLGCSGFPQLKIQLAQDLAVGRPYVPQEVNFDDTLPEVRDKVLGSGIQALRSLSASIDCDSMQEAIDRIMLAGRILICAKGLSTALVAADLHRKLIFLRLPVLFYEEAPLQVISAAELTKSDVVIAISLTGYNSHVIQCAKLAIERKAFIIGITRSDTALSAMSDILLPANSTESVYWYTQIATRLAHLAIIDVLTTGLALRRGPSVRAWVRKLKETNVT